MSFLDTIVLTCRDATFLHAKQKEGKLTLGEAAGLKVHLLYCGLCRLFFKQLDSLEDHAQAFAQSASAAPPLDDATKQKMQEAIKKKIGH